MLLESNTGIRSEYTSRCVFVFLCINSSIYIVSRVVAIEQRKRLAALSVGAIAILVVFPLWWKTTEVYRAPLPYTEIEELSHQQVCVCVSVSVSVSVSVLCAYEFMYVCACVTTCVFICLSVCLCG